MSDHIRGGYILLARQMMESDFFKFTPCCREVYLWLLLSVNFVDGKRFKRGQMFTSIGKIREELAWYVGFRKHQYSDNQIRTALNNLVNHDMIHTAKTTRGLHVTVCNYDTYQNPDNYDARAVKKRDRRIDQHNETENKPELYQKNEKNNNNNKKEIDKGISEIKDKDYSSVNTSVSSYEYDNQRQEYVEVVSEEKKNLGKLTTELIEISKGWLPYQPESERYLVQSVIKSLGFDKAKNVTEYYGSRVHKEETPIKSSAYWWKSGIYAWANKGQAVKPAEKKTKRRCETCKTTQSFAPDKVPPICPLCNEGQLLTSMEWGIRFPANKPVEPKQEETLTKEEEFHKSNVEAFLGKFASKR
tara:strand:+ start:134 stop:1210 length:1077 start_codon:yes stop_codon:yes gene_type:complete